MSKTTRLTEFNRKTRAIIYDRDNYRCIMPKCTNQFGIGVAHIFYPRSKGGLGVKENGVLLCQAHHHDLDNGVSGEVARAIQYYCETYLRGYYDINSEDLRIPLKGIAYKRK